MTYLIKPQQLQKSLNSLPFKNQHAQELRQVPVMDAAKQKLRDFLRFIWFTTIFMISPYLLISEYKFLITPFVLLTSLVTESFQNYPNEF